MSRIANFALDSRGKRKNGKKDMSDATQVAHEKIERKRRVLPKERDKH